MNNKQQLQQEIEALQKQLEEKQKALAEIPDKWEPKGGEWFVDYSGDVSDAASYHGCASFGIEYQTREQAEKAAKAMRAHNRLLAYVAEFAPDYKMEVGELGWIVCVDADSLKWEAAWCRNIYAGAVYMPEVVARELAHKLNSGEVEL